MEDQNPVRSISVVSRLVSRCRSALLHCSVAPRGTIAWDINLEGEIAGDYSDENGAYHGFLRARDGTITTFNVTGAGTSSGQGTYPGTNNDLGEIDGSYFDAKGLLHGFLRIP